MLRHLAAIRVAVVSSQCASAAATDLCTCGNVLAHRFDTLQNTCPPRVPETGGMQPIKYTETWKSINKQIHGVQWRSSVYGRPRPDCQLDHNGECS